METALELESCQLASLRQGRPVRGAILSTGEPGLQNVEQKPQWVDDLMQCIQRCVPKSRPEPGDVHPRRRIVCWECGQPGHLQRNCPVRTQDAKMQGNKGQPGFVRQSQAVEPRASTDTELNLPASDVPSHQSVFKTGIDLSSSNGLIAAGRIGDHECQITIDTGSNVSIIRPDILERLRNTLPVQPVESSLRTVTGATAPIQGRGKLSASWDWISW